LLFSLSSLSLFSSLSLSLSLSLWLRLLPSRFDVLRSFRYYFWRDWMKATNPNFPLSISPCAMNIIDPIDVALGEGWLNNLTEIAAKLFDE
jgi:hypothetical protein